MSWLRHNIRLQIGLLLLAPFILAALLPGLIATHNPTDLLDAPFASREELEVPLASEYGAHLAILDQRLDEALRATGFDGAVIFGTGYAPFRGGPLNYARTRGVDNVVATLDVLTDKFGGRFAADAGWETFK